MKWIRIMHSESDLIGWKWRNWRKLKFEEIEVSDSNDRVENRNAHWDMIGREEAGYHCGGGGRF